MSRNSTICCNRARCCSAWRFRAGSSALSVTREIERGTMENLLAMPIKPVEVMFGKIIPYVLVGFIQATLIISIGALLFGVPILGSMLILALLTTLFITTNLSIGYTF